MLILAHTNLNLVCFPAAAVITRGYEDSQDTDDDVDSCHELVCTRINYIIKTSLYTIQSSKYSLAILLILIPGIIIIFFFVSCVWMVLNIPGQIIQSKQPQTHQVTHGHKHLFTLGFSSKVQDYGGSRAAAPRKAQGNN